MIELNRSRATDSGPNWVALLAALVAALTFVTMAGLVPLYGEHVHPNLSQQVTLQAD